MLESKIKSGRSWLVIVLIILGWILSFPVLKFAVQARIEKQLNDSSFLIHFTIIVIASIAYFVLKSDIIRVEFDGKERKLFLIKKNKIGIRKRLSIEYDAMSFKEYNIKTYSSIELFKHGKRIVTLYRRDFSNEVYLIIKEKLEKISRV